MMKRFVSEYIIILNSMSFIVVLNLVYFSAMGTPKKTNHQKVLMFSLKVLKKVRRGCEGWDEENGKKDPRI